MDDNGRANDVRTSSEVMSEVETHVLRLTELGGG